MTTKELENWQMLENKKVCEKLKASGDNVELPRNIIHKIEFISDYKRRDLVEELEEIGFKMDDDFVTEKGYNGCTFSRDDIVSNASIDKLTLFLIALTDEHDAKYQGWTTSTVQ